MNKEFFDNGQYSKSSIFKYESIYGQNFLSPDGKEIADQFVNKFELRKNMIVLDIGCGLGGPALRMSRNFGVQVHGIDLSSNVIRIAQSRVKKEMMQKKIILKQGNCLELGGFSKYNVVHSRDVFLHIKNKIHLFEVVKKLLIRGGRLGFSDYCLGLKIPSQDFRKYLNGRKYYLLSFVDYIYLLRKAGFINVHYEDKTLLFLKVLKKEIQNLEKTHLNYSERNEIRQSWLKKIQRSEQEEQCWGWFFATKD